MIRNRMKEFRARTGMKQEELAARVGVRRETIGNLENGKYNPSLVLAWNIAKVFGVAIEDVLRWKNERETMKKLSYALFGLAVLLSDVMCWMVGYCYSDMLWGIRYACYSAPAWTAWLTALPFLAGIAVCVLLGAWLRRKSR